MRVTYQLTERDLRRYIRHGVITAKYLWGTVTVVVIALATLQAVAAFRRAPEEPVVVIAAFLSAPLVFGLVLLFLGPVVLWLATYLYTRHGVHLGLIGEHEVSINDSAIRDASTYREESVRWEAVHRVVQTRSYVLIYTSPGSAVVVPKRAFATPADAQQFHLQASRLWREHAA